MATEQVLKQLDARVDELIQAYGAARARVEELERRVGELEGRLEGLEEAEARVRSLEEQRQGLVVRLRQVVATVDRALGTAAADEPES